MRTAWIIIGLVLSGCFSEPGFAPQDAGDDASVDMRMAVDVGPDDVGTDGPARGELVVDVGALARIRPGESVDVAVSVVRGDVEGEIVLTATGLPSGVAVSGSIASDSSEGVLTVAATTAAAIGGPTEATLVATSTEGSGEATLRVVVAGGPGTSDNTFGVNGGVGLPAAGGDDTVGAVAIDDAGRVLVAGRSAGASTTGFAIALRNDGRLDESFGTMGLFTDFGGASSNVVGGLWRDGFVLNARIGGTPTLLRLTAAGVVDADWGSAPLAAGAQGPVAAGEQLAVFATSRIYVFEGTGMPTELVAPGDVAALAVDGAGRFLVGQLGTTVISRLEASGAVDRSFGTSGSLQLGGNYGISALTVTGSGGFVAAVGGADSIIAQFDDDGQLVPTFGTAGEVTTPDDPRALLAVGDGLIVVMDRGTTPVVVRYQSNGSKQLSFGNAGEFSLGTATGPAVIAHDVVGGRLIVAFPVGADIEVRRIWL